MSVGLGSCLCLVLSCGYLFLVVFELGC